MKTRHFAVNKLIRDNMLERQKEQGIILHERILDAPEYQQRLYEKLLEEAHEVTIAHTKQELIEELADLSEVMRTIMINNNICMDDVEKKRLQKRADRGGFDKKIFSTIIAIDENNPAIEYYKTRPAQYPEIKE